MEQQRRLKRYGIDVSPLAAGFTALGLWVLPLPTTQTARGDIVTLQVSGTVTSIGLPPPNVLFDLDGSVSVGSPYQLTFAIDTDASDMDPDPDRGVFLLVAASGQLGNYSWSRTEPPVYGIEVVNNSGGIVDEYQLTPQDFEINGDFLVDGILAPLSNDSFEFISAGISLRNFSANALGSDTLVIPTLNDWDTRYFTMHLILDEAVTGVDADITIRGTVDSIIAVPEPGAASVMGLLLAGYAVKRRDRNFHIHTRSYRWQE